MAKEKNAQAKKNLALPLAAALVLIAALALLLRPSGASAPRAAETGDLVIPLSEITETAGFYPVTVEGTQMEVLAVRTADGEVRTAFNTCQSCYTSGHGYYVAEGTELICQNCGFRFTAEQVGLAGRGCNPWPITASERQESEESVTIPYAVLEGAKDIFARWEK